VIFRLGVLDEWFAVQIEQLISLQAHLRPALDGPMEWITALGAEPAYVVAVPLLYWCVQRRLGTGLLLFVSVSMALNGVAKWFAETPRPYWLDSRVVALAVEGGFGLPSGHTQNAFAWLWLASLAPAGRPRRWGQGVAVALIALIAFSRLYLGVHFPHDLVGGACIGLALWAIFVRSQGRVKHLTTPGAANVKVIRWALWGGAALIAVLAYWAHARGGQVPEQWRDNALMAHRALGADKPLRPFEPRGVVTALGVLIGLGGALPWAHGAVDFSPAGTARQKVLRLVLGVPVLGLLYGGLSRWFPGAGHSWELPARAARYALMVSWVIAAAPWLFLRLGLASRVAAQGPTIEPWGDGSSDRSQEAKNT
jgi:membrane-associated phospholipid phosphatase